MQLRDIEGFSYKEIAEILEIDINLVKQIFLEPEESSKKV